MIFYVITDGHGSYIRKDEFSGKYVPVRNASFAERFEQRCKAANVLKNAIGKNIRSKYKVVDIEEETAPVRPTVREVNSKSNKDQVVKTIASEKPAESQTKKWVSGAETLTEFVMDAEKRKEELVGLLSEVDKEISDINHYIEFGKFNAYQGWLAFTMLLSQRLTTGTVISSLLRIPTSTTTWKPERERICLFLTALRTLTVIRSTATCSPPW